MNVLQGVVSNFPARKHEEEFSSKRTLVSRVLQKLAMSSAEVMVATVLLQKDSNASFSALWNSELLLKLSTTYCRYKTTLSIPHHFFHAGTCSTAFAACLKRLKNLDIVEKEHMCWEANSNSFNS